MCPPGSTHREPVKARGPPAVESRGPPRFAFAAPPPGARACPPGKPPAAPPRGALGPAAQARPRPTPRAGLVLAENWAQAYATSDAFEPVWSAMNARGQVWPEGYKLLSGKVYHWERLCVPESRVWALVKEHHEWNAHVSAQRLKPDIELRFELPPGTNLADVLARVKQNCLVCQASHPPNWAVRQPIAMTPIPPGVMSSVCLDVFSMPQVEWDGMGYDAYLLCVDRLSGWMVARPTQSLGLTAQKAARLLLDTSWGEVGVPAIITSDQGSQFASQWWGAMCSRLGVRQAFSQAHRHQANGRAEVAGKVLQELLRKMHQDGRVNWVEALPRALRIYHDTNDPVLGMSPYKALFGRDRPLGGLPWVPEKQCREAQEFFDSMEKLDQELARKMNIFHDKVARQTNARRSKRPPYEVGDYVWFLRPKAVVGPKLETWWRGPFRIEARVGESSYMLKIPTTGPLAVHADQLKPCVWQELTDEGVPVQVPPLPAPTA